MNPVRGSDFSIDISRSGPVFHDPGQAAPSADILDRIAGLARSAAAILAAYEAELTAALVIAPFAMALAALAAA